MANIGPKGILRHIDDPMITVVGNDATAMGGKTWNSDSTTSATDFVRAVAAGKGLHYKGIMDTGDDSLLEFASAGLYFAAQEGHCAVETLIQFEDASELAFTFGFNDAVEDGNLPIDLLATTLTKTASTFCGFVYDGTDASHADLHCVWVNNDSIGQADADGRINGKTIRMAGMAPTDAKWLYLKVELQDRGSGSGAAATFLAVDHVGRSMSKTFNTSVDRDCPLCYHLGLETRTTTGGDVFIKNCNWEQTIPNM